MTAIVEIEPTLQSVHRAATEEANAWRGRCIGLFGRGEDAISQFLVLNDRGRKLPVLLGKRLERLSEILDGRTQALNAVSGFCQLINLRNALAHGNPRIYVDQKGRWLLHMEFADREGRQKRSIRQEEGETICQEVHAAVQRLEDRLKAVLT